MSLERIVRTISGRLSLRQPQTESLSILHNALEAVPDLRDSHARSPDELKAMQKTLSSQFPTLTDFEREFPSMCFALATTGVGKWRLMAAFISYLCAAQKIVLRSISLISALLSAPNQEYPDF